MTITCQPMDATAGSPAYSAQNERQNMSALYGGGSGLALGARSGFRVGTPPNILTVTSTTWTLGPCAAVITPKNGATAQGSYRWASDANITGTGSQVVQAADSTYDRKDIVYIQVNDSSSGDGSGLLTAPVLYLAGAAVAVPSPPTLPDKCFLVGTITVPKVGGGSPTVVLNPAVFVAAGAPLPVFSQAERDALPLYKGFQVLRMDLPGCPTETCDGAVWSGATRRATYTAIAAGAGPALGSWGFTVLTPSAGVVNNPSHPGSAGRLILDEPGDYTIDLKISCTTNPGNLRGEIKNSANTVIFADNFTPSGQQWGVTVPKGSLYVAAGTEILFGMVVGTSTPVSNITATIDVRKNLW